MPRDNPNAYKTTRSDPTGRRTKLKKRIEKVRKNSGDSKRTN